MRILCLTTVGSPDLSAPLEHQQKGRGSKHNRQQTEPRSSAKTPNAIKLPSQLSRLQDRFKKKKLNKARRNQTVLGGGCEQVTRRPVVSLGGGHYRRMRQFEFPGWPELGVAQDPRKRSLTRCGWASWHFVQTGQGFC